MRGVSQETLDRALHALKITEPATARMVDAQMKSKICSDRGVLKNLEQEGKAHVIGWIPAGITGGKPRALWRSGPGVSVAPGVCPEDLLDREDPEEAIQRMIEEAKRGYTVRPVHEVDPLLHALSRPLY